MAVTFEGLEEATRTVTLVAGTLLLAWLGRTHDLKGRRGWRLILSGLSLLALGSAIDLFDESAAYARLPALLVDEPYGVLEILTEFICPAFGTLLLVGGFLRWLPLPARLSDAEARLREANATLRATIESTRHSWDALLENVPDYVLLIDQDLRIQFANRAIPGLTIQSVKGERVEAFVPDPVQREALKEALRNALAGGPARTVHLEGEGPHGTLASYLCRIVASRSIEGRPAALMLNTDVTSQLRTQHELEDRKRMLEETQALAHLGSWSSDLRRGTTWMSHEALRIWGLPAGKPEVANSTWQALLGPTEGPRLLQLAADSMRSGNGYDTLVRHARADGAVRTLRCRGHVSSRDGRGEALVLSGTVEDVTEEHDAQEALRASEERFRLAARATRDVIWDWDVAANQFHHTDAMLAVFGHDPASVSSSLQAWADLVHPDDRQDLERRIADLLTGPEDTFAYEYRFRHADGSWRIVQDRAYLLRGKDGQPVRVVGAMQDVTQLRHTAAQAEAQAAEARRLKEMAEFKTTFLNNAAHELATPLTPLKLQLATMRPTLEPLDPPGFNLLERNVDRLGILITDLLDAARLQSGRLRMTVRAVRVADVVGRVGASFRSQAKAAGVALHVRPGPEEALLECDETRLEQVLFNLVHNAIKFTPPGGQVWMTAESAGPQEVIEVRDTGIGLTPTQMAQLFTPFTQVHDGAGKAGGTGLGLYIARGIAEQHQGTLSVDSPGPGKGSTFELRMPLRQPAMIRADASAPHQITSPRPPA